MLLTMTNETANHGFENFFSQLFVPAKLALPGECLLFKESAKTLLLFLTCNTVRILISMVQKFFWQFCGGLSYCEN